MESKQLFLEIHCLAAALSTRTTLCTEICLPALTNTVVPLAGLRHSPPSPPPPPSIARHHSLARFPELYFITELCFLIATSTFLHKYHASLLHCKMILDCKVKTRFINVPVLHYLTCETSLALQIYSPQTLINHGIAFLVKFNSHFL